MTTSRKVSAIPIAFTVTMNVVRMIWIRSRRLAVLSLAAPNSSEPYAGVLDSRPLCRVRRSRIRPSRWATLGLDVMLASA